jgi:hypothetical protein
VGIKPPTMTVMNYPAEWLLDLIEDRRSIYDYHRRLPYVTTIELPSNYVNEYSLGALTCFLTLICLLVYWIL